MPQIRVHVEPSEQTCLHTFTSSVHSITQSSPWQVCMQVLEEQVMFVSFEQRRQSCVHVVFTLLPHSNDPHAFFTQIWWQVSWASLPPQFITGQVLSLSVHDWRQSPVDCCTLHVSIPLQIDTARLTTVRRNDKYFMIMKFLIKRNNNKKLRTMYKVIPQTFD